jgi:zinc protease
VPEVTTLRNGLSLLTASMPGQRVLAVDLVVRIPLSAEPRHLEGVATIAAHALDEGSAAHDADGFAVALDRIGATWAAEATTDGIHVRMLVPRPALRAALELLAEGGCRPAFPADAVQRIVRQRLDRLRLDRAEPPRRAETELLGRLFAEDDRSARPAGGEAATVAGVAAESVADFYAASAGPRTASLVITGDLPDGTQDWAEELFGSWDSPAAGRSDGPARRRTPSAVLVDRPGAAQTQLAIGTVVGSRRSPDWAALSVATLALGGTMTARIDTVLREEKGYTYGTRSTVRPRQHEGLFVIAGGVQTATTADAMDELDRVVDGFVEGGPNAAECAGAVSYLLGVAPVRQETARLVADQVAALVLHGLPADQLRRHLAEVAATTPASALAAFRAHVARPLSIAAVGDADVVGPVLERRFPGAVTTLPL